MVGHAADGRRAEANVGRSERVASALLGGTLLAFGLGRRSPAGMAVAVAGGGLLYRAATGHCPLYEALGLDTAGDLDEGSGATDEVPEAIASVTIGRPSEELERLWREPQTLPRIMGHFAEITPASDGRMHWRVRGPFGRTLEWDTRPTGGAGWESVEGAALPNEGTLSLRPAPGNRGTEATLRVRFDPPGGGLGRSAARLLGIVPRLLAAKTLHDFRSLAMTGEIPTTEGQPAARADTR